MVHAIRTQKQTDFWALMHLQGDVEVQQELIVLLAHQTKIVLDTKHWTLFETL